MKINMKNNINDILYVTQWLVIMILVVDFISFVAWALLGQIPVDGFYFGVITHKILQLIF